MVILRAAFGHDFNSGADAITVALRALQFELQPMVVARTLVHPYFRGRVDRADHDVQTAVAIQVTDCGSPVTRRRE